jgi:hypothetical protein
MRMNFMVWLIEQLGEPTKMGRFAKICWDDANNGCALRSYTPQEWKQHFIDKHPESKDKLISALTAAYVQYTLWVTNK